MELKYFILRRVLLMIPTILGLTILVFFLLRLIPNALLVSQLINPHSTLPRVVQEKLAEQQLGLNYPMPLQYFFYINNLLHGNWGYMTTTIFSGPVLTGIEEFFPNTLQLVIFTMILSIVISIPIGTYIGARPNSAADHIGRIVSLVGYAIPVFWFALILQMVAIHFDPTFPINGMYSYSVVPYPPPSWLAETGSLSVSNPTHMVLFDALIHGNLAIAWSAFLHLILPVLALTFAVLAGILRFIRAGMVDAANQEYVKTARAKGVPEKLVIKGHIRKNALIPTVTVMGLLIAGLLSGVPLIEVVFGYYGIGLFGVNAALTFQIFGVMDTTLVFGFVLMFANLIVDIVYGFMDPRIRY